MRARLASQSARPVTETTVEHPITAGDSFAKILGRYGIEAEEIQKWYRAARSVLDLRWIHAGRTLVLSFGDDSRLGTVRYRLDDGEELVVRRLAKRMQAHKEPVPGTVRIVGRRGIIQTSFYDAAREAGVPEKIISQMADILGGRVDFSRLQAGNRFRVLFEERSDEKGESLPAGRILAADLTGQGLNAAAFLYEGDSGPGAYFDAQGQPLEEGFLRFPLEFTRITSAFSSSRFHPILKRRRPHNGVDFAAPAGTPVRTVGSGKVTMAGWQSGFGRHVEVDHGNGLVSTYSHLSAIGRSIRPNQNVKRGQVIGFVGQTGLATGPHLHFAMFEHGRYMNPLTLRPPPQPVRIDVREFAQLRTVLLRRLHGVQTDLVEQQTEDLPFGLSSFGGTPNRPPPT